MRILGIDPGPTGFAWAKYDDQVNDIVGWGWVELPETCNPKDCRDALPSLPDIAAVVVERIAVGGRKSDGSANVVDAHVFKTAETVGIVRSWFGQYPVVLVTRIAVKSAIPGCGSKSKDSDVNAAMKALCPSLNQSLYGLNGDTRSAAAIAYVGAGKYLEQRTMIRARKAQEALAIG